MPIPAEAFFIDRASTVPLQVQLRRQIIAGVLEGRFRPGERMPSARHMAGVLAVARVTVTQAYAELVAADYLTSRDRAGHFVSDRIEPLPPAPAPAAGGGFDWDAVLDTRLSRAERKDRVPDWRRYRYPFVYGQADPALVDHAAWRDCARRALGRREFVALTGDLYDSDDPELVDYILRHILPRRGIRAEADQVLLTLGAQNGLWLAAEVMLGGRTSLAAFEDPGYPGLRTILAQTGARLSAVAVDEAGLDPEAIPQGTSAVFTTASHHSPTGVAMSPARRARLLERAGAEGFAVIEDDYEFEMSFAGAPSPALKAMDAGGAVIHVGSFSKSVFPGLRLGYLVADRRVIHEARALRALTLRHPPGMLQRTLAHFLALGHYDTQMNRMRRVYAERRAEMARALVANGLVAGTPSARGGSSFWLATPGGIAADRLAAELRGRDVLIEPGAPFFTDPSRGAGFYRLAYSSIPAERIAEGIARIAAAARR
ncbi:MocR-like pyridoxine biosynthesis transcription factor PdxR [Paenirhodobacter enshiensis]|uniref:GntR family transcriptional regulator n=1 Tax=Paenirhodobacter enshiensis TaxID=1105367 RepID=A0A086Y1I2_9RHOB|nr:PLP-dependent aminotransferase family protein [Paenirhodobacter enshiensis]KFI28132.1 GntR family transcriptional regulator [Paenirhodobacter enshiensis]